MGTLAETGMWIVNDDVLAKTDAQKLVLLEEQLGLDPPQAEAAFEVLRDASHTLERIRQTAAVGANMNEGE